MIKICDNLLCTGCGACYSACPKQCITMCIDKDGFIFPSIDTSKCVKCGICQKICPVNFELNNKNNGKVELPSSYAVISKDINMLKSSSSGGAFGILATITLNKGGVVFGAAYDKDFKVTQTKIDSIGNLYKLQGSKYVQSEVGDSYKSAKLELDRGVEVLYTGTPCQIAGLKRYLRKSYNNLTTIDILCHGVPNQTLFTSYIKYLESKHNSKVISYSFRDKEKWGWGNWGSVTFKKNGKNKIVYFPVESDYYYSLYFKENCFRESCYNCLFAKIPRQGDFTIGDLWGAEELKFSKEQFKNGISLVFVNNNHAQNLLKDIKQIAEIKLCDTNWAIEHNKTAIEATFRPKTRDSFYLDFAKLGFEESAKCYCKLKYIVPYISRYLPSNLKKILKAIVNKLKSF